MRPNNRLKTGAADWKWILARGQVVAARARGEPLRMAGTHRDINQRKEFGDAIQRREARPGRDQRSRPGTPADQRLLAEVLPGNARVPWAGHPGQPGLRLRGYTNQARRSPCAQTERVDGKGHPAGCDRGPAAGKIDPRGWFWALAGRALGRADPAGQGLRLSGQRTAQPEPTQDLIADRSADLHRRALVGVYRFRRLPKRTALALGRRDALKVAANVLAAAISTPAVFSRPNAKNGTLPRRCSKWSRSLSCSLNYDSILDRLLEQVPRNRALRRGFPSCWCATIGLYVAPQRGYDQG